MPKREWDQRSTPQKPLGQWLVENVPRGLDLDLPDRKDEPGREIPFQGDEWDWEGTAAVHHLTVATRNVSHFQGLGVDVISPWEPLTG